MASADNCRKALQEGLLHQARAHAMAALQLDAGNREAHLCLGRTLGALGDSTGALVALEKALQLSVSAQERAIALTLIGNQLLADGQYEAAVSTFGRSLEIARAERLNALQRIDLMRMADSHAMRGDWKAALDNYQQAAPLAANDGERGDNNALLAVAYRQLGLYDKAIEHGIKAVMMYERGGEIEQYTEASVELAESYSKAGRHGDAVRVLEKILALITPAGNTYWEIRARIGLCLVHLATGDISSAEAQLQKANELSAKIEDVDLHARLAAAKATLSGK